MKAAYMNPREAVRKLYAELDRAKLSDKKRKALISRLQGSATRKISQEEYERVRQEVFAEFSSSGL